MMEHTCHAFGCTAVVEPKLFMCKPHWFTLPKNMRDRVWCHYRRGQEVDKRPSRTYLAVAAEAQYWLQAYEHRKAAEKIAEAARNPTLF